MREDIILAAIIPLVLKENQEILQAGGSFEQTYGMTVYEFAAKLTKEFIQAYSSFQ